jgi:hypothetical protein
LADKAEFQRRRYATPEGRAYKMYYAAKARARRKGIKFTIKLADIQIPDTCPLLGIPLRLEGHRRDSPSLDRLDSSKGYTPKNVWVISQHANTLKGNGTLAELKTLVRNLEKRLGRK